MIRPDVPPIVTLTEAQAFLRIETGEEEALLAGMIRSASAICETFLNQAVLTRDFSVALIGTGVWQPLDLCPVRAITGVSRSGQALPSETFAVDVGGDGCGRVQLPLGQPCEVHGTYGLALDQNEVPEPIRHGVLCLTAHLYSYRDSSEVGPPAIVTALWRPYRRMVLA